MKNNRVTQLVFDVDGSVMSVCETITLAVGIKADIYTAPGATKPREIVLTIGDDSIEMTYSEELAEMLDKLHEVSALELLTACYRTLWQSKAKIA